MGKSISTRIKSKGECLNWTPLKDAVKVKVNLDSVFGRTLTYRDLEQRKSSATGNQRLLVP